MITFLTREPTNVYLQYVDAHMTGFMARLDNESCEGLEFENEAQELGFKAGWHMGELSPEDRPCYWAQYDYWTVWNQGLKARFQSQEYENPYSRGSWRWRAFLGGWCARNYQELVT